MGAGGEWAGSERASPVRAPPEVSPCPSSPSATSSSTTRTTAPARPVVLIHGWPLSGRTWEAQVGPLVEAGFRVVTYDRRGFGWSSQPWDGYDYDTFTADLAALLEHLDLRDVTLVGFSMGGGEVARYLGTHGSDRIAQAVFAAAVPPYLYKSEDNPDGGLDDATIEQFQGGVTSDRLAFLDGFLTLFFSAGERADGLQSPSASTPATSASWPRRRARWTASPRSGAPTSAQTSRNRRADARHPRRLRRDRPARGQRPAHGETVADAQLVVVEQGPHGLNASHADEFNAALLEFVRSA